jgi:glycosyltransferase involved in cell wall biosynthesis
LTYDGRSVDAVIVDRLWRPDISPALANELVARVRAGGARLIYAIDDDLLALRTEKKDWTPTEAQFEAVQVFLSEADGVWVTTPALKERFAAFNPDIGVVPSALDERLLPVWRSPARQWYPGFKDTVARHLRWLPRAMVNALRYTLAGRKVIGYMGTFTHDSDLSMVLPALRAVWQRHQGKIAFQLVGVIGRTETYQALQELPVRIINPAPTIAAYPHFLPWFSTYLHWDIAIAPLQDTPFNRCKSDIKFLDYSALGTVGIYSRVPAYETTVRHRQTGWLAENTVEAWIEALEELISNEPLRRAIARQATQYLHAERILNRTAHKWVEAIETLLEVNP